MLLDRQWKELALRHAPRMWIDKNEPFRPVGVGVTVLEQAGPSPSFNRRIEIDGASCAAVIEYAVYWDYDIQHLYDLEHMWVYLSPDGEIADCEASFHGHYLKGIAPGRANVDADGRVNLYVQPGKHAYSPMRELFELLPDFRLAAGLHAGTGGVLEPEMLRGAFGKEPEDDELAALHLESFRFDISGEYVPYEWEDGMFVAWEELKRDIPARMISLLNKLREAR